MTPGTEASIRKELALEFPKAKTIAKADVWWMRLLGLIMGSAFRSSYLTTIGQTIYLPLNWPSLPDQIKWKALSHERIHLRQDRDHGLWYKFSYLCLFFPIGLAWFRYRWEREAYAETLRCADALGHDMPSEIGFVVETVCGKGYLYAWPFKESVRMWFEKNYKVLP